MPDSQDSDPSTRPDTDAEEKRWLTAAASGDRAAFEALFRRYYPRLLRFCYRICPYPEHLEEIANDTLWVVWRKASSYDGSCRPSTWIFAIAYRKCRENQRQQRRHRQTDSLESHPGLSQPCSSTSQETSDWLTTALAELPDDQRIVVELTYYHGLSYRDIARIMDCPENTVKTRMFHARKKLQRILPRLADPTCQR